MLDWKGALYLAGAFALAGSSVIAAKMLAGSLDNLAVTAASLFLALTVLLPACMFKTGKRFFTATTKEWGAWALQGFFGIFLFRWLLLQGLTYTSSSEAGILTGITPAATALLAVLLLHEQARPGRWLGIILTAAGIMLINGLPFSDTVQYGDHLFGNILIIGAALSESLFNVLSRSHHLQADSAASSARDPLVQATAVTALALAFCLAPLLIGQPMYVLASLAALDMPQWLALAWYGWIVTALAFIFWYQGIKRCEASAAAVFSGMMPLTALALAVLFLGDHPGWHQWLGGALVIAGMTASSLHSAPRQIRPQLAAQLPAAQLPTAGSALADPATVLHES